MDLKSYLAPMTSEQREAFASRCSTSRGHLQNVMYGVRPCAPELAVQIEKHSDGAVTRRDLRDDWRAIWPELAIWDGKTDRRVKHRSTDRKAA